MTKARYIGSMLLSVMGLILLAFGAFSGITAPGTNTVNIGLVSSALQASVWGFGLLLVGMLMRRPPAA